MTTILRLQSNYGLNTVLVQSFIDRKSAQLVYYINAYWHDHLPYKEFENFMWDTLEEWTQVEHKNTQLYSHKERVFWHLLHETQYATAEALKSDDTLKNQIELCLQYLQTNRACPLDVVGMRP